jgi:putative spermidine/putrescine transport system substrate-binding protein
MSGSDRRVHTRRVFLRTAALTGFSLAGARFLYKHSNEMVAARAAGEKRIVYATWGGSWEAALRKGWLDPFTKKTGTEIVTVQGPDYGKLRAMVKAGNVEWDVAEVLPDFPPIGQREGLLEPIDWDVVKKSNIGVQNMATSFSVPQLVWARVLTYNTNRFTTSKHPGNWGEVWDVKRFPGKRAFNSSANGSTLEAALLADGVAAGQLYPLDIDRALKSLDRIRDDIIWYDTGAQQVQYWKDQQAVTGVGWDGRVLLAKEQGAPVNIEYNQSFLDWSAMVIPKGAPHKDLAMQFLAYTATAEAQADVCKVITYGPMNPKAFELLSPERARILSGGPQMRGKDIPVDEAWWSQNTDRVQEKLNAWRLR